VGAWGLNVAAALAGGGTSSLTLGGFAFLVLVAGYFWSGRAAVVVGVASITFIMALPFAERAGWIAFHSPDWMRYAAVTAVQVLLTMVVLAAGLRVMSVSRRESDMRARELREIVEEMPDGIIILDRRGRVAALNPAAELLTGFRYAHVQGRKVWDLNELSEVQRTAARSAFTLAMSDRATTVTFEYAQPDATEIPVEIVPRTVTRADGRRALMIVLRDLRERRRAEEERSDLEARVRQMEKLESVGRLAGGIAHDFNNLLTVILTNTELLLMDASPGPGWEDDVHHIRDAARRGASLTAQLLTFARQELPSADATDVSEFLSESEDLLRKLVGPSVELDIRVGTGLAPVRLGRTQVEQVLMNLVANARDAAGDGGSVIVQTRTLFIDRGETSVVGLDPGEYVRVRVADDGAGMPPEVVSRVFEPFFTTRRAEGGTGLGLATVHGIVRAADGDILVESNEGQGATFDVYLPRAQQSASSMPPRSRDPRDFTPRGMGRALLLVEDEEPVAKAARRLLERDLWEVVWASGVEDAKDKYASSAFAVVVCDVVMNDGTGPELIAALEQAHGPVPVVYVSGYSEVDLGDAPLVAKPFRGRELIAAVAGLAASSEPSASDTYDRAGDGDEDRQAQALAGHRGAGAE
jgi:PAS domain S-box-containing protein